MTAWLIWCGVALICLAAICLAATIGGMMLAFDSVASSEATPDPADLAGGISLAAQPSIAAAPLVILGVILVVAGFVVRRNEVR